MLFYPNCLLHVMDLILDEFDSNGPSKEFVSAACRRAKIGGSRVE